MLDTFEKASCTVMESFKGLLKIQLKKMYQNIKKISREKCIKLYTHPQHIKYII